MMKSSLFALLLAATVSAAEKPNVLFIAVDDLKPMLGCYGDTVIKTPNIDRLAGQGTTFLNAHCQQAVCGPSRASLLTGLRPDTTQVWDLKTRLRDNLPDVVTLPQHFKANGYESVGLGKIFDPRSVDGQIKDDPASWSRPYIKTADNPDSQMGFLGSEFVERAKVAKRENRGNWNKMKEALGGTPAVEIDQDVPDDAYDDGIFADKAVELIGELSKSDKPFFLAVGFKKPHLPFVAPKKYADLYSGDDIRLAEFQKMPEGAPEVHFQDSWELKNGSYAGYEGLKGKVVPDKKQRELIHGYMACVSYIDAQVGKLLDALDKQGVAENTIVVFWGDHGWHLGDHGMWCKHTNYEQATRVPMIISKRAKGGVAAKSSSPVEFIDIFPTLCDIAGLERPDALEGESLVPVIEDPEATVKDYAISQYPRGGGARELMGYALRDGRYRYVRWVEKGDPSKLKFEEFYDYESDPLEKKSLIDEPGLADVVKRFRAATDKFLSL
ncbi:iduronate-2-sulfatase [Haloferula helveola]|uniref:Iduronate-2-sulfatase n=1 Tax=Haloferula helveola TaxID=490095 RepID=A0ABN6H808_9BACT|nr:iduronate-2-sulfatase [Haloferula helveola]